MRTLGKCAAIVALCLTFVSCLAPVSREEVIGKYARSTSYGIQALELNADGQYIHVFKSNGQVIHNKGSWKITYRPGGPHVILDKFQRPENPTSVSIGESVERGLGGLVKIGLENFSAFTSSELRPNRLPLFVGLRSTVTRRTGLTTVNLFVK